MQILTRTNDWFPNLKDMATVSMLPEQPRFSSISNGEGRKNTSEAICLQVHPLNPWSTMLISNTTSCNGEHRMQGVMADKGRASPMNDDP